MYLDFYKLHLKPFQISTDPKFLWLGEKHKEALAVLKYGILDNKGFLLLTGDVGTGKTTLLNSLIDSLGDEVLVAMVTDPGLAKLDFFNFVADSFEMQKTFKSKGEFLISLKNFLLDTHRQNKQALLIIDECQHLNQKLLEEVRLLSNIEKYNTKLINIFFVGQSEFNNIILRPRNRAIRQRISINYNISALSESETDQYIRFRLRVAGSKEAILTSRAIKEVFKFSNGYPRLINIICDQVLLTGYVKEKTKINEKIVAECATELKIPYGTAIHKSMATPEAADDKLKKPESGELELGPSVDQQKKQFGKLLLISLIVILTIWFGMVATFVFYQKQSSVINPTGGTHSGVVGTTERQNELKETQDLPDEEIGEHKVNVEDKMDAGGTVDSLSVLNRDIPELSANQTTLEDAAPAIPAASVDPDVATEKTPTVAAIIDDAKTEDRISLDEIKEKFGVYPEVQFGFNSNNLDDAAYERLDVISQFCLQNPETIVILRGYTDKSGVRGYNLKLSEFRADMVKTYLVGRGVKVESITSIAIGPGEEGPGGTKVPYDGSRRKVLIEIISPNE